MVKKLKEKIEMFPKELKEQDRWCNWRSIKRKGRPTKMPISSLHGGDAKSNDESTWADFEKARGRISKDTGIGYFFKPPYVGIDIDDVEEEIDRHLKGDFEDNIVSEFIHEIDSYTEISPSGTGIHIIMKGELPEKGRRRGKVEMYGENRFFTVTFNSIGPDYIRDDHETGKLKKLHEKYITTRESKKGSNSDKPKTTVNVEENHHGLEDEEVVRRAIRSKQGVKFSDLYNGDWDRYPEDYPSQSEADMSFMNMLAFWTAKDRDQMDRIMRDSGLYRDKWDERRGHDTYGNIVIDVALEGTDNVYTPTRARTYTPSTQDNPFNFKEPVLRDQEDFPVRSADDTGNAERLVDRYGDIIRYSYNRDKFYIYDGQVWSIDDLGRTNILVDEVVDSIEEEEWMTDTLGDSEDQEAEREKVEKRKMQHVNRSRSNNAKVSMLRQVRHRVPVSPDEFDEDRSLLNTQNGYVDLATGEISPPDKKKMFSMITNAEVGNAPTPHRWLQFLDETFDGDKEMIDFMQRAAGYSITGSTREEVMFVLHGKGQNGKSKFVEGMRHAIGSYSNNIQAKTLMVRSTETINNDIAKLQGSRIVTSSEPSEGFRFDEGLIKQLTGGDVVTARFLFGEEFNFHPEFKLWLTTNVKPIIKGTDDGIWRRILLIPFDIQVPEEKKDKDLTDKFIEEVDGILQWIIEGTMKYNDIGLNPPEKVINASKSYRNEMDDLEQFIADKCEVGEDLEESASLLFERYKQWADETINDKMNRNKFGQKLKEKFNTRRLGTGIHYQGLKLKD